MMDEILVLVEHRKGEIRDVTYEMLSTGRELAEGRGAKLTALLLGQDVSKLAEAVASRAESVEVIEDARLAQFNSDAYQQVLSRIIRDRKPVVTLIGHTAFGLDLAPSLAAELRVPLITDVTGIEVTGDGVVATRPVYGGKARAKVRSRGLGAIITAQSGAFAAAGPRAVVGQIVTADALFSGDLGHKKFLGFVEAAPGDVDITQSDLVVSVGRGIGDPKNLSMVEDLAAALGGVLACSRPVVDKKWLPKSRQVGISGKTVQPKLYLAVGISGAFQHLSGIKGSGIVVAINKDPKAPIFRVADYGIVGDLFTVVPALKDRIIKAKGSK